MHLPNSCHTVQFSKSFFFAPWTPYNGSVLDLLGAFDDHRPPAYLLNSKHPFYLVPGYAIDNHCFASTLFSFNIYLQILIGFWPLDLAGCFPGAGCEGICILVQDLVS
jgi:hypothetical protein